MIDFCLINAHVFFFCFDKFCLTGVRSVIVKDVMLDKVEYKTVIRFLHLHRKIGKQFIKRFVNCVW